jgi:hypothetical protein
MIRCCDCAPEQERVSDNLVLGRFCDQRKDIYGRYLVYIDTKACPGRIIREFR